MEKLTMGLGAQVHMTTLTQRGMISIVKVVTHFAH